MRPAIKAGKKLFEFSSFEDWINHAASRFRQHNVFSADHAICVDAKGRICGWGKHFNIAQTDAAFPVKVYLLRADMEDDTNAA